MNLGRVIIKKEDSFYKGTIENSEFILESEISGIKDVQDVKEYKTLRNFFIKTLKLKTSKSETDRILDMFSASAIWVYDPDKALSGMGKREWESGFYKHIHPLCKSCVKKCKQSSRTEIISCKSYKKQ